MPMRQKPNLTERSRVLIAEALAAYQAANPEADLEASINGVRKASIALFREVLFPVTNPADAEEVKSSKNRANTYFQNRRRELLTSSLPAVATSEQSEVVETTAVAASAETPVEG